MEYVHPSSLVMKAGLVSHPPIPSIQQHTSFSGFEPGYPLETTSKELLPEQYYHMLGMWLLMTMLCM